MSPDSGYFISLILNGALVSVWFQIIRFGPFFLFNIKNANSEMKTTLQKENIQGWQDPLFFIYMIQYPYIVVTAMVCLFFSITMPVTPVFGVLFYSTKLIVDKYLLIFVYPHPANGTYSNSNISLI